MTTIYLDENCGVAYTTTSWPKHQLLCAIYFGVGSMITEANYALVIPRVSNASWMERV